VGHNASRLDPARIGTPYHPMQVGASYNSPSPQHVMTWKFSPVVYVHPISQVSDSHTIDCVKTLVDISRLGRRCTELLCYIYMTCAIVSFHRDRYAFCVALSAE